MTVGRCFCPCHNETQADHREYMIHGQLHAAAVCEPYVAVRVLVGASRTDVIEAAAACPVCLDKHCPALAVPTSERR
jgi:hypothetical protein